MLQPLPALQVTHGHRSHGKVLGLLVVNSSGREGLQWRPPEDDRLATQGPCSGGGAAHAAVSGRSRAAGGSRQGDGVQSSGAGVGWGSALCSCESLGSEPGTVEPGGWEWPGAETVNPLDLC